MFASSYAARFVSVRKLDLPKNGRREKGLLLALPDVVSGRCSLRRG